MFARCFLAIAIILLPGIATLNAATINIENEPPELISLRQSYQNQKQSTLQPIDTRYQQDIATVEKLSTSRPELKKAIISEYEAQKNGALKGVNDKYVKDLEGLEQILIQRRDLKGALLVQEEKKRVMSGTGAVAASTTSTAAPIAVTPRPAAASQSPGPFTYKSETEGLAGAARFSKNNVYKFNMSEVRSNTKLTAYAAGRGSKNTYGEIFLITPAGQRIVVKDWSPSDFSDSMKEVMSYKKLDPIVVMISQYVTSPGTYQVSFEYNKGIEPLIIKYVELKTW
jgi:hypothetical protein